MEFRKLSDLNIKDSSTWEEGNIYLTFDVDWAHDEVILDTINLLEAANVTATWFVTHCSPILDRLRCNPNFELGIHPNFNFLLNGDNRQGRSSEEVVDRLLEIVPEATSVRSHSLIQGGALSNLFYRKGLRVESNIMMPLRAGCDIKPFIHQSGMIMAPLCWGDHDSVSCAGIDNAFSNMSIFPELCVLNFHPIHVYLNTERSDRYEESRDIHRIPEKLINVRSTENGVRSALERLIQVP